MKRWMYMGPSGLTTLTNGTVKFVTYKCTMRAKVCPGPKWREVVSAKQVTKAKEISNKQETGIGKKTKGLK